VRSIVPIAEQLDRALAELGIDHPLNGRIALILVDNGLELMCHQKCADLLFEDRHGNSRRLSPEQRSDARGRAFDRKIQFLKELGHIPPDQVRAMAILHEYRNQLYHVGLRDDPIIGQLAHVYFRLAAGLLESLLGAQRHLRWEPEAVSDAARRLLPELATTKYRRAKVDMTGLRDRLLSTCPQPPVSVERALSAHLLMTKWEFFEVSNCIADGCVHRLHRCYRHSGVCLIETPHRRTDPRIKESEYRSAQRN
jgi:hypothetical protein